MIAWRSLATRRFSNSLWDDEVVRRTCNTASSGQKRGTFGTNSPCPSKKQAKAVCNSANPCSSSKRQLAALHRYVSLVDLVLGRIPGHPGSATTVVIVDGSDSRSACQTATATTNTKSSCGASRQSAKSSLLGGLLSLKLANSSAKSLASGKDAATANRCDCSRICMVLTNSCLATLSKP
jgi:hypothetical protein